MTSLRTKRALGKDLVSAGPPFVGSTQKRACLPVDHLLERHPVELCYSPTSSLDRRPQPFDAFDELAPSHSLETRGPEVQLNEIQLQDKNRPAHPPTNRQQYRTNQSRLRVVRFSTEKGKLPAAERVEEKEKRSVLA